MSESNSSMSTPKVLSPIDSFRKEAMSMETEFSKALPPHIPKERFMRVLTTAVQTSMASNYTNLLECDRRSLWQAAMRAAQDGLLADGREGAILPYMGKAQWVPMVAGIRKKARNSGEISTWDVHCVYKNDHFVLRLGDAPSIEHTYDLAQERGELIGAYSVALLKDGSKSYEVMSIAEIHAIRNRSQAWQAYVAKKIKSTPWATDEAEMARKTVAKRHAKQLPSSADLDDLMRRDDDLYNFKKEGEEVEASNVTELKRPKGKGALDQFAAQIEHKPEVAVNVVEQQAEPVKELVDQTTGEVLTADEPLEPSPADAHQLGFETRMANKPRRVPVEVEAAGTPFAEAWFSGWDDADEELAVKRKK